MSKSSTLIREASHAGSWYSSSKPQLSSQLDGWLAAVTTPVQCIGPHSDGNSVSALPVSGARIIIAPHAGYAYSGPAAAWAYKAWDVSKAKRVFLLGPSHHHYLTGAALSQCTHYETPLGNLTIDRKTTKKLHEAGGFSWMDLEVDEAEHSLEMHLPYIYKMLSKTFGDDASTLPPLVPIMVGNTPAKTERTLGQLLAPHLADPSTAFVISSDFAHWGSRFGYTFYRDASGNASDLRPASKEPKNPRICDSIRAVDFECMGACESGKHDDWLGVLRETGNTVCGRHPIGVMMCAVEELRRQGGKADTGAFKFVRYERSSEVIKIRESSVSYASAFAIVSSD